MVFVRSRSLLFVVRLADTAFKSVHEIDDLGARLFFGQRQRFLLALGFDLFSQRSFVVVFEVFEVERRGLSANQLVRESHLLFIDGVVLDASEVCLGIP